MRQITLDTWRLEIPAGKKGTYRLAQLDDYTCLPRGKFLWQPPVHLYLQARISASNLPGTWGFGLWNDPFTFSFGLGGMARRFPALPNAAWFFFATPPNYLSFRNDLPAQGFLAQAFSSPKLPTWLMAIGSLAAPLLMISPTAQLLRSLARRFIREDSTLVSLDMAAWHEYELVWLPGKLDLLVDGSPVLETEISPSAPLGLVCWIDNQYAALPPKGRLSYGFLANPQPAWLEVQNFVRVLKKGKG